MYSGNGNSFGASGENKSFSQVRNLELLKLRFGESNLHFCDVMIKDIADSKRINGHVVSKMKKMRMEESTGSEGVRT